MEIGVLVFPGITATDYVAPADLLARMPGANLHLVWKHDDEMAAELGWRFRATRTFANAPALDILLVPGGPGVGALLADTEVHDFLRHQARTASWVVGVCTGSLVLGCAGLLKGYRATTHWASHDLLAEVGAVPVNDRVVTDRNRVTGAGMTSGIDCALRVIALNLGEDAARGIQLFAEYDPQPPVDAGCPDKAPPALVAAMRARIQPLIDARRQAIRSLGL